MGLLLGGVGHPEALSTPPGNEWVIGATGKGTAAQGKSVD